jgi:hypothetical protein
MNDIGANGTYIIKFGLVLFTFCTNRFAGIMPHQRFQNGGRLLPESGFGPPKHPPDFSPVAVDPQFGTFANFAFTMGVFRKRDGLTVAF